MKIKDNMWKLAWHVTRMLNCRQLSCPTKEKEENIRGCSVHKKCLETYLVSVSYEKEVEALNCIIGVFPTKHSGGQGQQQNDESTK
jgi:hypothetical protein